ncbi:MAG: NAD(P)H-dependent oxidoreductase [Lachnospiraceae bacterium]|nr:NAD(P)H-dependent oxidoreductase [Lachnospiraceae bacterium]
MKILMVDACPRKESRTRYLAERLLEQLHGDVTRIVLAEEQLPDLTEEAVVKRGEITLAGMISDPLCSYAKQFADAECIVIAAPYWDLSFPAILKKYIEAVMVTGITFTYSEDGRPVGLCNAEKLYYVSTAGGPMFDTASGYGYIKTLANVMWGIPECRLLSAENLDIIGADVEEILNRSCLEIEKLI